MKKIFKFIFQALFLLSSLLVLSFSAEASNSNEFKLEGFKSGIYLPVKINEEPYTFLLDTGSTFTVLNSSFKPILGKPLTSGQVATTVGKSGVEYYRPIDVVTGDINIKTKLPYIVADLDFFSKVTGKKFDGIAGMAFIHKYIWNINFDEDTVKILSELDSTTAKKDFSIIKLSPSIQGVPFVPVEIGGEKSLFMLDTADTGSGRLTSEMIDLLSKKNLIEEVAWDTSVSLSGITKIRRVRVREIKVGPHTYNGLLMQESKQNSLGLSFLYRHHVIIDFPNQQLYLKKGLGSFQIDRLDKSGIKMINDNKKLTVALVDERGPAKSAGILKGDIIKSINNLPVSGNELIKVRELFKGDDGEEFFLTINRNDEDIDFLLKLKKGFDFVTQ